MFGQKGGKKKSCVISELLIHSKQSTPLCPATLPLAIFLVEFQCIFKVSKKWKFATGFLLYQF